MFLLRTDSSHMGSAVKSHFSYLKINSNISDHLSCASIKKYCLLVNMSLLNEMKGLNPS